MCPHCVRRFTTKTGLGVHLRAAHKSELDVVRARVDVKVRWSDEESAMLAMKEVELVREKVYRLNEGLRQAFPHRTLESIKSQRRKQTHKDLVERFRSSPRGDTSPTPTSSNVWNMVGSPPAPEGSGGVIPETTLLTSSIEALDLEQPSSHHHVDLRRILMTAAQVPLTDTLAALSLYLLKVFPPPPQRERRNNPQVERGGEQLTLSRRKQRRKEYARVQSLWRKDCSRVVNEILEGPRTGREPDELNMTQFWQPLMETDSSASPGVDGVTRQDLGNLWVPVTKEELDSTRPDNGSAAGPDGVTARLVNAMPRSVLSSIMNLFLFCRDIPDSCKRARTVFLPKKPSATEPCDYRPITIPSILQRCFHSVLAKRLVSQVSLNPAQAAFLPLDGCARNITVLDLILKFANTSFKSCYVASLDIAKAFDSVSHDAILDTAAAYGCPVEFTEYLRRCYETSTTCLTGKGWTSGQFRPKRGVKQGDPLSPMLFNMVVDRLLNRLPDHIKVPLGAQAVNAIAYADDLLLFANTPAGLQELISLTDTFLSSCGLNLNPAKCATWSIKGQPKQKCTVVESREFKVRTTPIPCLGRTDTLTYLGVKFGSDGRIKTRIREELVPWLDGLTRAPLKPQQRMFALRTLVLPKVYHKLTLGGVQVGCLRRTDTMIRHYVRRWLRLPQDIPMAFLYAAVKDGGLGVPSLRWQVPLIRRSRLNALNLPGPLTCADFFVVNEVDACTRRLTDRGVIYQSKAELDKRFKTHLLQAFDGRGLENAEDQKQAHRWISSGTNMLTGRDYVNCIRTRIGALPVKSRTSRGRGRQDRMCRAGCMVPETIQHAVQVCHRSHGPRIARHDQVVKFVARNLRTQDYTVHLEPRLQTAEGIRKPDIVAVKQQEAFVIDAQVVSAGFDLRQAHRNKVAKYDVLDVTREIKDRFGVSKVGTTSVTLNWKGIWSHDSAESLLSMGAIKKSDLATLSTRVLIGTFASVNVFMKSTSARRSCNPRTGIG